MIVPCVVASSALVTVTEIVVQSQPSIAEWLAGGATALSAVVIAWQAFQTRRSVRASEDAVTAARDSVVASREAVGVSQEALTESRLARVENGVPRITVTTKAYPDAHLLYRYSATYQESRVNEDVVFKLPRDAETKLYFAGTIIVRNDGPGTVIPEVHGMGGASIWGPQEPIFPGDATEYTFRVSHTVAEWVELSRPEASSGGPTIYPVCGRIAVTYRGPRDSDIDETHPVVIRGSALLAVEDAQGDWRRHEDFSFDTTVTAQVAPATRIYWRSRAKGLKFSLAAE